MTGAHLSRPGTTFVCAAALAVLGCGASEEPQSARGPLASHAQEIAARAGVPADLVLAIAAEEGGLKLPRLRTPSAEDHVPIAGIMEIRHGKLDTLARGAELLAVDQKLLIGDTDLGTEAGIRVLAELGPTRDKSLSAWKDAIAEMSGLGEPERSRYVARVYQLLYHGGTFAARDGESVRIAAHPEIPIGLTLSPPPLEPMVDFPGAQWFETSCSNKCNTSRPDGNDSVNLVVIHDTEGGWDASVATLQYDSGKSVHYIVDADGSRVGQFIPETYTGWHAGNYCYNKHSVGIEHVGYVSDDNGYQTALYQKSVELVKSIVSRWPTIPIDRDHVVGHYQIPNGNVMPECSPPCSAGLDACESDTDYGGASHHTDPGYHWQWCQYMEMLGSTCACNDAWSLWNCTNDKTEAWRCNNGTLEKQDCANGCDVMPIGTPDVCHVAEGGSGGTSSGGASSGGTSSGGASSGGTSSGGTKPVDGGGWGGQTPVDAGSSGGSKVKRPTEDDGGCGCRTPAKTSAPANWIGFVGLLLAGLRRRRRVR